MGLLGVLLAVGMTGRGVLIPLALTPNILSALTGTAAGSLTITFQHLGDSLLRLAAEQHVSQALLHRAATIGAGTLDREMTGVRTSRTR